MRRLGTTVGVIGCGLAICAAIAVGAGLKNGNFEKGTFKGWSHKDEGNSGDWFVYKGRPTVESLIGGTMRARGEIEPLRLPKPRQGQYAAATAQGGPGTRLLFRNLKLKPDRKRKLSFLLRYDSDANLHSPPTLHVADEVLPPRAYAGRRGISEAPPNQQYRVDVLRKSAGAYSLKAKDVLDTLLASKPSDPNKRGWKRYAFNLSSLPAGKVKLRVAEVDNRGVFVVAFDDLKLKNKRK